MEKCDLLIRNAYVIDGTGTPGFLSDVAVKDGRVTAMGQLPALAADRLVDAEGKVLAPGFIDAHTHDDQVLLSNPDMVNKVSQGVTTVITGNCGFSLAPVAYTHEMPLSFGLLGAPEGYEFPDFGAYLETLEARPAAVNAGVLVGHSALRYGAMDRLDRAATAEETAQMRTVMEHCMAVGALGLSTGLHYPPAKAATTEEVIEIAKVVGQHGGIYTTHMRNEADEIDAAIEEALLIGREGDVPVLLSHHKLIDAKNHGRSVETLARINAARQEQTVAIDVYPYNAGSTVLDPVRCDGRYKVIVTWSKPFPEMAGKTVAEIATIWGVEGVEAGRRLLPAGAIYFMLDEADVQRIMTWPHAMFGSDGLPHDERAHPRLWGTFPRILGHYVRELGLFSLENAVHRMTGMTAAYFGLQDRGIIRPGAFADLTIFDPATIIDRANYDSVDNVSDGILTVVVNGTVVWHDGVSTGKHPGKVLRRQGRIGHGRHRNAPQTPLGGAK
jgi:N-acyl-D-amino-acid deacylase